MPALSPEAIAPRAATPPEILLPIELLLAALEARAIRYCHWKGNASIGKVLAGEKDLDLLLDARSNVAVAAVLAEVGFRRIVDPPGRGFPGVEHYLALDYRRGRFAHLHLHWQMIPTKGNHACVRLPWEEIALSTRVKDARHEIYIPAPELELLVFLVRGALRVRAKHLAAERIGRPFMDAGSRAELRWLAARTTSEALYHRAVGLLGERAASDAAAMMNTVPSAARLRAFRARMTQRGVRANSLGDRAKTLLRRDGGMKRTLPAGGRVVAFLGSDGAGKSTVVRAIADWLGSELDVRVVYLGSGDGPASLLRRSLRAFDRLRRTMTMRGKEPASGEAPTVGRTGGGGYVAGVEPGMRALWKIASKLALAREKRDKLATAWRARTRGAVVICDRYPQTQQPGFNDGPLLTPWLAHPSQLLRSAARRELSVYRAAAELAPDLVIKLTVSPGVAASRKDDMSYAQLRTRGAAVRALSFPAATQVVEIDADRPLEAVLDAARRAVWECL